MKLEDIKPQDQIIGLIPNEVVTIIHVQRNGDDAITVVYLSSTGVPGRQLLHRDQEAALSLATKEQLAWSFDSPAEEFKLALEAKRMELASLFDPMMAVNSSDIEPLPHQISAVYESMLPKLPLRFVLADDPGAGKTIMAGLLIKELISRGDVERVLIVAPGSLVEQWQDEMREKFDLKFEIFTTEKFESSSTGNYFKEEDLLIARLDQLSRDIDKIFLPRLEKSHWDLIIVDEAHKMSTHVSKNTKRFQLGKLLSGITDHFLLMTATPHNGKEDEFQAWLSLLDPDRFYPHKTDKQLERPNLSDVMRRMIKEELLKFDGTRLFPQRVAYTVDFNLTPQERELYDDVTRYVVDEMNRADSLLNKQQTRQVGFALTILQRRLASSPKAIYESLLRRRQRLEKRLEELKIIISHSGKTDDFYKENTQSINRKFHISQIDDSDNENTLDDLLDDLDSEEYDETVGYVLDNATAAKSIPEFKKEIEILKELEKKAESVYKSGSDTKWSKLSGILQEDPNFKENRRLKKLIIFTEHRDTLEYLKNKIENLLGNAPGAVLVIHGQTNRDLRREIQETFRNNDAARVLIATDAAGEGVNLQCAHMMINYDLPWNPNRIEQRFGRIHRIGQTQKCFLWNLVAGETREGQVFNALFAKIQQESDSLKGRVFDVLGQAFEGSGNALQELILKAIRSEDSEENIRWMTEKQINTQLDHEKLKALMKQNSLVEQVMSEEALYKVKEEMDKAEARKLQPCFVRSFFCQALRKANGDVQKRPNSQYRVGNVPGCIRKNNNIKTSSRKPILRSYDRICFDKNLIRAGNSSQPAEFIYPGHPLMLSLINYTLTQYQSLLKPGAVLVDPSDLGVVPSVLCMIEHEIRENGTAKPVSRRLQFVRITETGEVQNAGWAPHLDLEVPSPEALRIAKEIENSSWINNSLEQTAADFSANSLAKEHFNSVKSQRIAWIEKVEKCVRERLLEAIQYYEKQRTEIQNKPFFKTQKADLAKANNKIDELRQRFIARTEELNRQKALISVPPVILGGILVIPQGLINQQTGVGEYSTDPEARSVIEKKAMDAVMEKERSKGCEVFDVSAEKCGWDVTSRPPRNKDDNSIPDDIHIEVKGRVKGATTVSLSRNEICYAINQKDKYYLAIVLIDGDKVEEPIYIRAPFNSEPEDGLVSCNFDLNHLISKAER